MEAENQMELIRKYFPQLTPLQIEQFTRLFPIYTLWNQKINVISRKDIDHLYLHHVLHSLAIARIISFKPSTHIIDAGTGGGFPGIPLAILFPECHFILNDSIRKKITVVQEVILETGLKNCETRNLRMEELKDKADFVVSRAVTEVPQLIAWIGRNIRPGGKNDLKNGLLALKGGDLTEELKPLKKTLRIYNLSEYFSEPYFETKKMVHIPI